MPIQPIDQRNKNKTKKQNVQIIGARDKRNNKQRNITIYIYHTYV